LFAIRGSYVVVIGRYNRITGNRALDACPDGRDGLRPSGESP
jgi:hypothetical protein